MSAKGSALLGFVVRRKSPETGGVRILLQDPENEQLRPAPDLTVYESWRSVEFSGIFPTLFYLSVPISVRFQSILYVCFGEEPQAVLKSI